MGGLLVATVLTLLVVPALYAAWFRVRRDEPIAHLITNYGDVGSSAATQDRSGSLRNSDGQRGGGAARRSATASRRAMRCSRSHDWAVIRSPT